MRKTRRAIACLMAGAMVLSACAGQGTENPVQSSAETQTDTGNGPAGGQPGSGIVTAKEELAFPLGQEIDSDAFTGTVYITPMIANDEVYNFPATNNIIFEPGARSSWHSHGGMVILGTGGVGYYQEEGKPAQIIREGDVVQCAPGVKHWHGAAPDSWFSQMVIFDSSYVPQGEPEPEELVTEEWYASLETEEFQGPKDGQDGSFMFAKAQEPLIAQTFSGPAYVSNVLESENTAGAPELHYVVFDKGVINNWHTHVGGQILIATDGIGYHQIEGQPVEILYPGDVALCPPGVKHWHGGSADTEFAHLAVNTNPELTGLEWFDRISDEEYERLSSGITESADDGIAKGSVVEAQALEPWEGVRMTMNYGAISPQAAMGFIAGGDNEY